MPMTEPEPKAEDTTTIERSFDDSYTDFVSFYSDFTQVLGTGSEIRLQFYETIPGTPTREGRVEGATSRLRASITVSAVHAQNIGRLLVAAVEREEGGASK
jgi:hypothetical protein